jgi:predicted Zn-dependent protease
MKKITVVLVAALLTAVVPSQEGADGRSAMQFKHKAAKGAQSEFDEIWGAAEDRFSRQLDFWFKKGEFPKVTFVLSMQYAYDRHDQELADNLGWMYWNMEMEQRSVATYKSYIAENPKDPWAKLNLATHYFVQRKYKEVIPLLKDGAIVSTHPNHLRMLARSYEREKLIKESVDAYSLMVKKFPKDQMAKNNLARVKKKLADSKG